VGRGDFSLPARSVSAKAGRPRRREAEASPTLLFSIDKTTPSVFIWKIVSWLGIMIVVTQPFRVDESRLKP
jgi:hypothetical protein